MNKFNQFLRSNKWFLLGTVFYLLGLGFAIIISGSPELFLLVNGSYNKFTDVFFMYETNLGDGFTAILLTALLLWYRRKTGLVMAATYLSSSGITQLLKHTLFEEIERPKGYFKINNIPIRLIDGLEVHTYNSFPSGHATTAFAIFSVLAFSVGNKSYSLGFLAMAIITCFSRVYLAQHFPADILAGSFIGFTCAIFCYLLIMKIR